MIDFFVCPNCFRIYSPEEVSHIICADGHFWCHTCLWRGDEDRPPFLSELAQAGNVGAAKIRFALALMDALNPQIASQYGEEWVTYETGRGIGLVELARAAGMEER